MLSISLALVNTAVQSCFARSFASFAFGLSDRYALARLQCNGAVWTTCEAETPSVLTKRSNLKYFSLVSIIVE